MTELTINASSVYTVAVGQGIIDQLAQKLTELGNYGKIAVVSDSNVAELYLDKVLTIIAEKFGNDRVFSFVFPAGETSKNMTVLSNIYDFLAEVELTRTDAVVALGGGVAGDMVGYASATYLRGMDFINIPTTLLAMVDSAVGGKTAVNIVRGKNLVGAFKQPKYVMCDIDFLETLDKGLIADGIGEIAKYAVLEGRGLFKLLLKEDLRANYREIIELCVAIKADYVSTDEFDVGKRQMLNLGHTLGHVIEKDCKYEIHHGKAVLAGMYLLTEKYNFTNRTQEILDNLAAVAKKFGIETNYVKSAEELWSMAGNDKKRSGDYITIVRPYGIGDCRLEKVAANSPLSYSEAVKKGKYDLEIYNNKLSGEITAPPSKSHAHRLLIAAALRSRAERTITVGNVNLSDDVKATLNALKTLGYTFEIVGNSVIFGGRNGDKNNITVDCGECGSTFRFFIPICAMLGVSATFTGTQRLGERGYGDIIKALNTVNFDKSVGLPLKIKGKYSDDSIKINGNITSQFVSGLLLGAMAANRKLFINISGSISSRSYIDLTAEVIEQFGGSVTWTDNTCVVNCSDLAGLKFDECAVESDYSNGAFFSAAGLKVNYNNPNSTQGDKAILDIIASGREKGYIDYDINNTPDLMPILAVFASTLSGKSEIQNGSRLRIKECDRLAVMQDILTKCGVDCAVDNDNMIISGGNIVGGFQTDSYADHRIAMAAAVLATFANKPIKLANAQVVAKSYPNFWEDFVKAGGYFNVINVR